MLHLLNSAALKAPGCIWSEAFCFYLFHYAKGRKVLIPQRTVAVQVQVAAFSLPHICSSARPFKAVVALQCWKQSRAGCCRWKQLQLSDVSQTCRCLRIEVQHKRFSCPKLSLLQKSWCSWVSTPRHKMRSLRRRLLNQIWGLQDPVQRMNFVPFHTVPTGSYRIHVFLQWLCVDSVPRSAEGSSCGDYAAPGEGGWLGWRSRCEFYGVLLHFCYSSTALHVVGNDVTSL